MNPKRLTLCLLVLGVVVLGAFGISPRFVEDDYPGTFHKPGNTQQGFSVKEKLSSFFLSYYSSAFNAEVRNNDGEQHSGSRCIACTTVVAEIEQLAVVNNESPKKIVMSLCNLVPGLLKIPCKLFIQKHGKIIIEGLEAHETPDVVCRRTGLCWRPQCNLFPPASHARIIRNLKSKPVVGKPFPFSKDSDNVDLDDEERLESIWSDIIGKFEHVFNDHIPLEDLDKDKFSTLFTFRGTAWRGKDCSDTDPLVYPGRKSTILPASVDHNCNGIYGKNSNGHSYEDQLCANSQQRGVAIIGDSASAHFRLPPMWFNASEYHPYYLNHFPEVIENEADWPHLSWATGHTNDTTGLTPGPVDSIYLRLRARNLCNHRDYQNIGVNGARTGSLRTIAKTLARSHHDHPAVVFYAPIGNDVCSGHPDFEHMTTPANFYSNVMETMEYLDTTLPAGSHVVFIGLADGRFLYNTLHNKTHPIGVPYPDFYSFLSCYDSNPCWGWLNTNQTVRDLTSKRAAELSAVYKKVMANKFKNFKTYYYNFPLEDIAVMWRAKGGSDQDLIEPVDGFHPSQIANALQAQFLWNSILFDHPEVFGPVNPNNLMIQKLFGNQEGH